MEARGRTRSTCKLRFHRPARWPSPREQLIIGRRILNWQAIGAVAELFGAAAVFLMLIYLALQIRQNTPALQSSASQAVHENFALWYGQTQSDPVVLDISIRGMADYSSLSETERAQFIALFTTFSIHTQNAFYKWREGSLAPDRNSSQKRS